MKVNYIQTIDSLQGLQTLPDKSIDCVVTSPPYWGLRDYGVKGQIGLEKDFNLYITRLVVVFTEVFRVLKDSGTLWVNIDDSYWGSMQGYGASTSSKTGFSKAAIETTYSAAYREKPPMAGKHKTIKNKSLVMIPERFALAMVEHGWILRNTIIWKKPNATPESVKDRFTNDYERVFFFTKQPKYYFNQQFEAFRSNEYDIQRMKDGRREYDGKYNRYAKGQTLKLKHRQTAFVAGNVSGRNMRAVWEINTKGFKEAHFAVFPEELIEIPIQAGCPKNGVVLDPFMGSGTTAIVALKNNCKYIGFELNPNYVKIANKRLELIITSNDLRYDEIKEIYAAITKYIDGKTSTIEINQTSLNGLMGIASETVNGLNGLETVSPQCISSTNLPNMHFETIGLQGKYHKLIGDPSVGFTAMVYGLPKSGKSTLCIDFAKYLAEHHGRVLYVAIEEGFGYTLKEKFERLNAIHPNLVLAEQLPNDVSKYDFVFIDSVSKAGYSNDDLTRLKKRFPKTSFVFIFHTTKDGNFRGRQEFAHEVDCIIDVQKGIASGNGRFGVGGSLNIFKD